MFQDVLRLIATFAIPGAIIAFWYWMFSNIGTF